MTAEQKTIAPVVLTTMDGEILALIFDPFSPTIAHLVSVMATREGAALESRCFQTPITCTTGKLLETLLTTMLNR